MRVEDYPFHDSYRGWFVRSLYYDMTNNPDIYLLTGDLGYKMFDPHKKSFPERFINTGAAECAMIGAGVGLALMKKIPFCYSITPFLMYRPFEWIRNYIHHENIPVRLVGSGLDDDYKHDGITHHSFDLKSVLKLFPSITPYFPTAKELVPECLTQMIQRNEPSFLCLRR